jgi:imidazolonepropionase
MNVPVDTLVGGISELATLARGPVPRRGPALCDLGTIPDAAMGLRAGRIAWIGPERAARASVSLRPGARRVDLGGRAVLPGFVDAHTHLLFAGDRHDEVARKLSGESYGEIARSGGGLYATVRATRAASAAELRRSALDRLGRMLRWGTTTAEVKSGYALTIEGEERLLAMVPGLARASGVDLVPTFLGAHAVPPERSGRSGEYIDRLIRRALPRLARRKLARFCDVFCEPGFFSVAESERLLRAARAHGLGLKVHADEFVPSGGTELAARLAVRSAEHLLAAPTEALPALAESGAAAVLLPVTPFAAMSGRAPPGRALVDAGVPVALGTDLSPNSWVEGMPIALAHAVYRGGLLPAEAIGAATVNAAWAIGKEEVAGCLAVGRSADFSVFPVARSVEIPYRVGALPEAVYRRGRAVFST